MTHTVRYLLTFAATLNIAGCASSFLPKPIDPPAIFTLTSSAQRSLSQFPTTAINPSITRLGTVNATLIISAPHANGGLNSTHMLYVPRVNELAYFAQSQWVDSPSAMLMPLIAQAIQSTGVFKAVLSTPTGALAQFRLDTDLIRLEQSFLVKPSQVQFALRTVIIDTFTRKVIAQRDFSASVAAQTEDAYGGVVAAQEAVQKVLTEMAIFCSEAVR